MEKFQSNINHEILDKEIILKYNKKRDFEKK